MKRPLIFITNDDGYDSKGISLLIEIMRELGDVLIVAPQSQQSGQSHSITVSKPLQFKTIRKEEGYELYACDGTPTDCCKVAFNLLLGDRKPDLLVSGINHGSNASINTIYSGTMAAVFEGAFEGVPSVGFSVDDHNTEADFSYCKQTIIDIAKSVLEEGLEEGVCLNVNFPKNNIKGVRVCHQARACWSEELIENTNPMKQKYYWLTGRFICKDDSPEADHNAMQEGYAAITPMQFDMTAYNMMQKYKQRFESNKE